MIPVLASILCTVVAANGPEPIVIGLDAEFGHTTSTSAQALELGASIAIDGVNEDGGVLGRPLRLITTDNRSIPARGEANLRTLAANPAVIAVMGGKFSTCVLPCVPVAQELGIPFLASWSSADGITSPAGTPNWIFRCSLRDAWVAPTLLHHASAGGHRHPGFLLPANGWGRSNLAAAQVAMADLGVTTVGVEWYPFGTPSLLDQYQRLRNLGADTLILVANEGEGATLVREVATLPEPQRLPIIAHWGITGGRFPSLVGGALTAVDLTVIQTFSFARPAPCPAIDRRVRANLAKRFPGRDLNTLDAPVGIAHAHDLVLLLTAAIRHAGRADRTAVREALERIGPCDGLVRRYERPFTPDRHEALDQAPAILCRWDAAGILVPASP